jgi:hypothetical protein
MMSTHIAPEHTHARTKLPCREALVKRFQRKFPLRNISSRVSGFDVRFWDSVFGFRFSGSVLGVRGWGFGVGGSGLGARGWGFGVRGSGFGVRGWG